MIRTIEAVPLTRAVGMQRYMRLQYECLAYTHSHPAVDLLLDDYGRINVVAMLRTQKQLRVQLEKAGLV